MEFLNLWIAAAICLFSGFLLGFLFGRKNKNENVLDNSKITEYIQKAGQLESVLESNTILTNEKKELKTKLDEKDELIAKQQEKLRSFEIEKASFDEKQKSLSEKYDLIAKEKETLLADSKIIFEKIAAEIMEKHSKNFKETNQTQISDILNPLKENIKTYQDTITAFNKEQQDKYSNLDFTIKQTQELNQNLIKETQDLTTALQNKKIQGNWGEMVLERVLEWAGLTEGREYAKQVFFRNENNERQYPDFIINLPKNRKVIIDSKMSIENYKKWANEQDPAAKNNFLEAHAKDIRKHIENLSAKEYQKLLKDEGLDFAMMFIPIEFAYFAALEKDPNMIEFASSKRIAIVTASSLFPVLKVVESLWQMDRTSKHSEEIMKTGIDMVKRIEAFVSEMENLNESIKKTQNSFDKAMIRLNGSRGVIKSAQKLENFGIKFQKLPLTSGEMQEEPNIENSFKQDLPLLMDEKQKENQ